MPRAGVLIEPLQSTDCRFVQNKINKSLSIRQHTDDNGFRYKRMSGFGDPIGATDARIKMTEAAHPRLSPSVVVAYGRNDLHR